MGWPGPDGFSGVDLGLGFFLMLAESSIHEEGQDRDEGRDEDADESQQGPTDADPDPQEGDAQDDEEQAMEGSDHADGHGKTGKVLQRHGDTEQHQIGNSLGKRGGPEESDRAMEGG